MLFLLLYRTYIVSTLIIWEMGWIFSCICYAFRMPLLLSELLCKIGILIQYKSLIKSSFSCKFALEISSLTNPVFSIPLRKFYLRSPKQKMILYTCWTAPSLTFDLLCRSGLILDEAKSYHHIISLISYFMSICHTK